MKRGKVLSIALVACAIVFLFGLCIRILLDNRVRDWIRVNRHYKEYAAWKKQGGPMQADFREPLMLDSNRDSMVRDLSYDQIVEKFPFLVDGDRFSTDSCKGEYLRNFRSRYPEIEVLWFKEEDTFDWCIEVDGDEAWVNLIKG